MRFGKEIMLLTVFLYVFVARINAVQYDSENFQFQHQSYHNDYERKLISDYYSAVFGPRNRRQGNDECPINYELTNSRNIEQTQSEIERCTADHVPCDSADQEKYRRIDGNCNNLNHPSWGRANNCLRRLLPYDYGDNVSFPRISCKGDLLPNPRLIADVYHRELKPHYDAPFTTHFMEWGQLIAHDVSLNDVFRTAESDFNLPPDCCINGPTISDTCYTVEVPSTDSFYPQNGVNCSGIARTQPCPLCEGGQRQHWNQNTAYLDASILYGSTDEIAQELRSGVNGKMIVVINPRYGPLLPTVPVNEVCVSPKNESACYKAGDIRVNQNLFLLTLQTMLLRYHNFICKGLHEVNPRWDDERLYQEARRILIAKIQKISYNDYLPHILGEIAKRYGLKVQPGASYTEYDPKLDAGIIDEFTNVAARYGHTHVPPTLTEVDPVTGRQTTDQLRNTFYTPFGFQNGQFDRICRGMTKDIKMKHDIFITPDLQNHLYQRVYLNETYGRDLTTISIIRGREHGIPGYTAYLKALRNITVISFADLRNKKLMPDEQVNQLQDLFRSVHDVDLYSAGLAEHHVSGALVGETFGIILGDQHRRMKFGDRYWYEHKDQSGSFTKDQLLEIKRTTLSRIICETTRITTVQSDVFRQPHFLSNPQLPCASLHRFNFLLWKDTTLAKHEK